MRVKFFRFMGVNWPNKPREVEAELVASFKKAHKGKGPRLQERAPIKSTPIFPVRWKI